MTIDSDQFIIYLADRGSGRIFSINYAPEVLENYGSNSGTAVWLYNQAQFGLKKISSLAVDQKGDIIWGLSKQQANQTGAVFRAKVDKPDSESARIESQIPFGVTAIHYVREWLIFATNNGSIYAKKSPHDGAPTHASLVASNFDEVVSIANLDTYIYIADKSEGLYAIKVNEDGTFSQVQKLKKAGQKPIPAIKSLLTMRLGASNLLMSLSVFIITSLII